MRTEVPAAAIAAGQPVGAAEPLAALLASGLAAGPALLRGHSSPLGRGEAGKDGNRGEPGGKTSSAGGERGWDVVEISRS